jgi:hypothetical protein
MTRSSFITMEFIGLQARTVAGVSVGFKRAGIGFS